jgi:hypothetical protein
MIRVVIVEIAICQNIGEVRRILAEVFGSSLQHFEGIALVSQIIRGINSDVEGATEAVAWRSWWDDVIGFELCKELLHVIMAERY